MDTPQDFRALLCSELTEAARLMRIGAGTRDGTSIHEARIALRRSCEYLKLVPFTSSERKLLRQDLKKCMQGMSKARDFDAYLEHLRRLKVLPSSTVVKSVRRIREDAYEDLNRIVARLSIIAESSSIIVDTLPTEPEGDAKGRFRKEFKKLSKSIYPKLIRISGRKDARRLHQFRIALKHLRYLTEIAPRPKNGKARLKSLRKVQSMLGDLQDVRNLREKLRQGELRGSARVARVLETEEKELFKRFRNFTERKKFRELY